MQKSTSAGRIAWRSGTDVAIAIDINRWLWPLYAAEGVAVGAGATLRQSCLRETHIPTIGKIKPRSTKSGVSTALPTVSVRQNTLSRVPERGGPTERGDIRSGRMEQHLEDQLVVALRDLAEVEALTRGTSKGGRCLIPTSTPVPALRHAEREYRPALRRKPPHVSSKQRTRPQPSRPRGIAGWRAVVWGLGRRAVV